MPYTNDDDQRKWDREYKRTRYQTDPEYAAMIRERERLRRKANPEAIAAAKKRHYEKTKEQLKASRKANREALYLKELARKYGCTPEKYAELLERSGNKCEICGASDLLSVDHCHGSQKVRGIVCKRCNFGLGYFQDNQGFLAKAIAYLVANG